MNFGFDDGGVVFDEDLQEMFDAWMADGNVVKMPDGYATQDALYRNRLKDIDALKEYFFKEFIKGQYGDYAKGGGVGDMYSKFDLNEKGNFSAVIDNKNYEIIYRDDTTQLYDLFENNKKIKSGKVIRDLMQFPKYAKGGGVGETKVVAFSDYQDFKYYVLSETDDNYIVVNEEKIEHWKNTDEPERSYYYEEVIPKSDVVVLGYEKNIFAKGGSTYAEGGLLDDKELVGKAIEYVTGSSIDYSTIQFEANNISFKYTGKNASSTIDKKLIEDTIKMHRRALDLRSGSSNRPQRSYHFNPFKKGGSVKNKINRKYKYFAQNKENGKIYDGYEIVDDVESLKHYAKLDLKDNDLKPSDFNILSAQALQKRGIDPYNSDNWYKTQEVASSQKDSKQEEGFNDAGASMTLYHEKKGNFLVPKGQIYLWLYDVENSADKLQSEEFDWVFYPYATKNMAWRSDFIPPLQRIWTKKFQKDHKGSEHLLGVIKAYLIDKQNGEQELLIDMMSVKPDRKKQGIMSYMIKDLRNSFNLTQDQVKFGNLIEEGKAFVSKGKYANGGNVLQFSR